MFGDSDKPVDRLKILTGNFWKQTLADGIPVKGFVRITFVFSKIKPKIFGVGEELFFFYRQERSNDAVFPARQDALKPFDRRPAQNSHQERFRLVVCVVCGENHLGADFRIGRNFVQSLVAFDSGVFFDGSVRFQEISVEMSDKEWNF